MGPLWLERKNVVLANPRNTALTLQWGRSGWSGRTGRCGSRRLVVATGFNGAALVGAEERRWRLDAEVPSGASMGPLWLERKNSPACGRTAARARSFNGAALVGAEERREG